MSQYLKQELFFRQLTGSSLLYPGTKWSPLGNKRDKTRIHSNPEYEASAHFMHVRQLLTTSYGIIARQCIIYYSVGFPSVKELTLPEMSNQL
jgi:hypothetical protein